MVKISWSLVEYIISPIDSHYKISDISVHFWPLIPRFLHYIFTLNGFLTGFRVSIGQAEAFQSKNNV